MDNNDSDLRHYLFIVDIATIIVSSFFLFKFESSYWLTKGSAVNQAAGFGDIFHDWAVVLFIAIPLISIVQMTSITVNRFMFFLFIIDNLPNIWIAVLYPEHFQIRFASIHTWVFCFQNSM